MVASDDELEGRLVLEEVLAHEACSDRITAGKLLYAGLGPAPALFGFRGCDEARAAKAGEIGRVAVAVCRRERLDRRASMVIAKYSCNG